MSTYIHPTFCLVSKGLKYREQLGEALFEVVNADQTNLSRIIEYDSDNLNEDFVQNLHLSFPSVETYTRCLSESIELLVPIVVLIADASDKDENYISLLQFIGDSGLFKSQSEHAPVFYNFILRDFDRLRGQRSTTNEENFFSQYEDKVAELATNISSNTLINFVVDNFVEKTGKKLSDNKELALSQISELLQYLIFPKESVQGKAGIGLSHSGNPTLDGISGVRYNTFGISSIKINHTHLRQLIRDIHTINILDSILDKSALEDDLKLQYANSVSEFGASTTLRHLDEINSESENNIFELKAKNKVDNLLRQVTDKIELLGVPLFDEIRTVSESYKMEIRKHEESLVAKRINRAKNFCDEFEQLIRQSSDKAGIEYGLLVSKHCSNSVLSLKNRHLSSELMGDRENSLDECDSELSKIESQLGDYDEQEEIKNIEETQEQIIAQEEKILRVVVDYLDYQIPWFKRIMIFPEYFRRKASRKKCAIEYGKLRSLAFKLIDLVAFRYIRVVDLVALTNKRLYLDSCYAVVKTKIDWLNILHEDLAAMRVRKSDSVNSLKAETNYRTIPIVPFGSVEKFCDVHQLDLSDEFSFSHLTTLEKSIFLRPLEMRQSVKYKYFRQLIASLVDTNMVTYSEDSASEKSSSASESAHLGKNCIELEKSFYEVNADAVLPKIYSLLVHFLSLYRRKHEFHPEWLQWKQSAYRHFQKSLLGDRSFDSFEGSPIALPSSYLSNFRAAVDSDDLSFVEAYLVDCVTTRLVDDDSNLGQTRFSIDSFYELFQCLTWRPEPDRTERMSFAQFSQWFRSCLVVVKFKPASENSGGNPAHTAATHWSEYAVEGVDQNCVNLVGGDSCQITTVSYDEFIQRTLDLSVCFPRNPFEQESDQEQPVASSFDSVYILEDIIRKLSDSQFKDFVGNASIYDFLQNGLFELYFDSNTMAELSKRLVELSCPSAYVNYDIRDAGIDHHLDDIGEFYYIGKQAGANGYLGDAIEEAGGVQHRVQSINDDPTSLGLLRIKKNFAKENFLNS